MMTMPAGRASAATILTVDAFPLHRHCEPIIFGTAAKKGGQIVV
jgi:hypothetical protein